MTPNQISNRRFRRDTGAIDLNPLVTVMIVVVLVLLAIYIVKQT